jgi:hypothetical protein
MAVVEVSELSYLPTPQLIDLFDDYVQYIRENIPKSLVSRIEAVQRRV